jgi:hypothetical protein
MAAFRPDGGVAVWTMQETTASFGWDCAGAVPELAGHDGLRSSGSYTEHEICRRSLSVELEGASSGAPVQEGGDSLSSSRGRPRLR